MVSRKLSLCFGVALLLVSSGLCAMQQDDTSLESNVAGDNWVYSFGSMKLAIEDCFSKISTAVIGYTFYSYSKDEVWKNIKERFSSFEHHRAEHVRFCTIVSPALPDDDDDDEVVLPSCIPDDGWSVFDLMDDVIWKKFCKVLSSSNCRVNVYLFSPLDGPTSLLAYERKRFV